MKKYTGTIILGFIALIFGTDTILSLGSNATISEWFYLFLHRDPVFGFTLLIGLFASLLAHFWWFAPKKTLQ
jgi:hypothetical protein